MDEFVQNDIGLDLEKALKAKETKGKTLCQNLEGEEKSFCNHFVGVHTHTRLGVYVERTTQRQKAEGRRQRAVVIDQVKQASSKLSLEP